MDFVRTGALVACLPEARLGELDLLIEEIFMNVCRHAYPDSRRGAVILSCSAPAPGELRVEVADQGVEARLESSNVRYIRGLLMAI